MVALFIEPVDVWLFRDGKPFDAGLHHRAESLFPPLPTVIQGAIRSKQLVRKKVPLTDRQRIQSEVGTTYDLKQLRLKGPFLACRISDTSSNFDVVRLFPQPADAQSTDTKNHRIKPATFPATLPKSPDDPVLKVSSSAVCPMLMGLDDPPEKGESGLWLTQAALTAYLAGNEVKAVPSKELFVRESRMSNAIEGSTRVTETGMLYEVEFIRCQKDVGLLVEVEGDEYQWQGPEVLNLGGEMRAAVCTPVRVENLPTRVGLEKPEKTDISEILKVYFATPAFFTGGWQPASWDPFFSGKVELKAAAVGRYLSAGGYDLADNGHKPSRRYVPAGSVYYFECVDAGVRRLDGPLTENSIGTYEAQCGFGQTILTGWEKEAERKQESV